MINDHTDINLRGMKELPRANQSHCHPPSTTLPPLHLPPPSSLDQQIQTQNDSKDEMTSDGIKGCRWKELRLGMRGEGG